MLEKLRSRHAIELPYTGFDSKKGILTVIGGMAVLFVFIPLLLALVSGLLRNGLVNRVGIAAMAIAFGTVALVIILGAIRGKPGWNR